MGDFFQGKTERIVDGTRYVKYLDLNKWYCVLVPKDEEAENDMVTIIFGMKAKMMYEMILFL